MYRRPMENILSQLKAYFDPHIKTSIADWRAIASYLTIEQVRKRIILKAVGEKEKYLRFILEGAAAMVVRQDRKDVCFDLCFENEFLSDFESLYTDRPTKVYIRTFEPLCAVTIDRPSLLRFYNSSALCAQLGRVVAEQQNRRNQLNHINCLGKTAEARYRRLVQEQPKMVLRTPQHYLASYLGVSTENLSRIRRWIGRG